MCLAVHIFSYLPKQLHDSEGIWFGKSTINIGTEVLSAVAMRMWDLLPCSTVKVN
jgi:hypothetical protein